MKFGPALRAAAGIAVLSIMDAVIKGMSASYPTFQVAFLRFMCGSIVVAGVVAVLRPGWPNRETVAANAIRSVIAVITALSFFYALGQLPLAETLVLSFLSPMFIALFGMLMLRERVDSRIVGAIGIGFLGTLVVVLGQTGEANAARSWTGVGAALLSAITYALSLVLLRQRAQRDKFLHIVIFQNMGPFLLVAPFGIWAWQPLHYEHLAWFALMGVLGVIGHVLMATAYAKAEAARLAPLEYTALIWAVLIGYGVFSEVPTWATLGGGILIVAAAMLTSRR
ncbi:DMT family transporter [Microvirga lotononidis]|uniref:EamA-like transporter family n=1 Tax=Microvirga lotononidis TaxID=864069 RepID=I4YUZ6_9HYPH|nr:DMT family transporter [Microvirga lotononidis]EIM27788.1 EamA-like transporter family [Microvirga lotononidis]WQO28079.1 DMT family transporter [Microvirga lotononidis]